MKVSSILLVFTLILMVASCQKSGPTIDIEQTKNWPESFVTINCIAGLSTSTALCLIAPIWTIHSAATSAT